MYPDDSSFQPVELRLDLLISPAETLDIMALRQAIQAVPGMNFWSTKL